MKNSVILLRISFIFLVLLSSRVVGAAQGGCTVIDSFTAAPVANGPVEKSLIVAKDNAFGNLYERDFQVFLSNGKISAAIFNKEGVTACQF